MDKDMGKISESFSELSFINEAQVSQNFVIPFLVEFLGYDKKDIIPEKDYPNKIIPFGKREFKTKNIPQSQRPDYVICQGSIDKPLFVVDSKGPSEKLEEHLSQLLSYSLGAGVNFLVLTNGTEMLIYYSQDEVVKLSSISDLDIYFEFIKKLLHKDVHKIMTSLEIINSVDFNKIARAQLGRVTAFIEMIGYEADLETGEVKYDPAKDARAHTRDNTISSIHPLDFDSNPPK